VRRIYEHKHKLTPGFTSNYEVNRLLFFENTEDVKQALEREKQIKSWRREKKIKLIESMNPKWGDLSDG
jgi:putative endonuclease